MTAKNQSNVKEKGATLRTKDVVEKNAVMKKSNKSESAVHKPTKVVSPANVKAEKSLKKDKPKKIKMIRDSYTMPESDYSKLAILKKKCLEAGIHVKKSELIRAGIIRLSKLTNVALLSAIGQVEVIKTGRPAKN